MNVKIDVKTAGRTLDVFEAFEALKRPTTLSEIASFLGAPISSCHGLLRTLKNRGYLYSVGGRGAFYPTKRLLDVAATIAANDPMLEQLGPYLAALMDETRETVILGKRQDDHIVYLDVVEGPQTIRYSATAGKIAPLHSAAIGKAILGALAPADFSAFIRNRPLVQVTSNTLINAVELSGDIEQGRSLGYFVTRGENVADVMAIACSIEIGNSTLGIAVAGPLPRMEANFGHCLEALLATCAKIRRDGDAG